MSEDLKYQEYFYCFVCSRYMSPEQAEGHKLMSPDHKVEKYLTVPNSPKYQKKENE